MTSTPAIAIVGGGPCGLTLARLLECKGIDYLVFERDEGENSNRAGGSLDIHPPTGQQALKECGLFEEFQKYARYDDTVFTLTDKEGNQVLHMGQDRDAPEIDRHDLRQILLESIPGHKIKWGHSLKSVTSDNGKPVLHFANGRQESGFKLVVGADGAWSKVRRMYSGKSYIEAKIGRGNPLYQTMAETIGPGMRISIGPEKLVITQRQGDGSYRTYFGLQVDPTFFGGVDLEDVEATRRLLLSHFTDWAEEYKTLIRHATDFRAWPLYSLSTGDLGWKSVSGFTVCGDAAHLSAPNGQGVNLAMFDAWQLASKIVDYGTEGDCGIAFDFDQAVQQYEAGMFPHGVESISEGIGMSDVLFSGDPQTFVQLLNSKMEEAAAAESTS